MQQEFETDLNDTLPNSKNDDDNQSLQPQLKYNYFSLYRYSNALDVLFIAFGTAGSVVYGCTLPIFTLLLGRLVNTLGRPDSELSDVNEIAVSFVILGVISWICGYLEFAFWMLVASRQTSTIRLKYLQAVLNQDISYFDRDQTSGKLVQGLNDDMLFIQQALGEKVGTCIQGLATFVAGMIVAFVQGWQLTLVVLAMIPFVVLSAIIVFKLVGRAQRQLIDAYCSADQTATQAISNVRTVASFNGEEQTLSKYERMLQLPMKLGIRINIYNGIAIGILHLFIFASFGVALWYGNELVIDNNYKGGDVLNVILAVILGGQVLGTAGSSFQYLSKGVVSANKIFNVIERVPQIQSPTNAKTHVQPVQGEIELRNIKFAYPARPDCTIFSNLSLVIPAGKTVALVGQSGSGKSTVVQLMERFYDPLEGTVLLDGRDIRHLDLQWYRGQIGLVSQEPTLFATTIRQNILYGNPTSTEEEIIQAAKSANAYQFITQLPQKFDTQVGERGVQLSGGQKQRIAIARAILKNPKIMLLDEATSALDSQSERLVQGALDNMIVGRTTLVIAHRLSTIRNADVIAVVQDGEIVEQDCHDKLIQKDGGAYQSLVKLQQQLVTEKPSSELPMTEPDENKGKIKSEESQISLSMQPGKHSSGVAPRIFNNSTKSTQSAIELQPTTAKHKLNEEKEAQQKGEAQQKRVGIRRLWEYNKKEWPFAILGCIASIGLGVSMPIFAIAFTDMIGIYFLNDPSEQREEARKWVLIFVSIGVGWLLFSTIQQYCFGVMGQALAKRIRTVLMDAILRQEIGWFDIDENSSGNICSRLSTDTLNLRGAVADALGLLIQNLVNVITGFVIAYVTSWKMALVVTASFPLLAISIYIKFKFAIGIGASADQLLARANQVAFESISAVRVVQAYNMQLKIVELYDSLLQIPKKTQVKQSHITGFTVGLSFCIIFCTYALTFWYGGREVEKGNINTEEMLRVFFAILLGAVGAGAAQLQFPDIGKAGAAVERVFGVIDRIPLIKDSEEAVDGNNVQGAIELRDVDFAYPQRSSVQVFKKFNLSVEAGQTVAMVGESGSGKSSVVGLIERFYIPQRGCITVDGVDIKSLKLKWLRAQIGLVSQEPVLFSMSVADNIKYGCQHATNEQVRQAATIANAADFIENMTQQYDTQVGEQGTQLSGGQKQRVAIARAIIKNPKILLLDEATSALDAESEKIVQEALVKIMEGRTTIVIAHRLSTIRNANKIVVVNKGIIAEQGTHTELMSLPQGLYHQMIKAQNQQN